MRCKEHLNDPTSVVGVCATCLREKLFPILAVQSQNQSPPSIFTAPQPVPTEKAASFKSRLNRVAATSANPPSWLASLFSGKKSAAVAGGCRRRKVTGGGRGMSPESDSGEGAGGRGTRSGDVAGLFCMSPLVRVRPKRREKLTSKSMPPKVTANPRFDTAESFCKNKSRKVADFGRLHRRS